MRSKCPQSLTSSPWRVASVAVGALVCVLVTGACSKEDTTPEKTSVRFVTWKPNQPEVWEEVYRRFHEEHPDLEVVREVGPHSSTAFHDLLTQKLKNRSRDVDVFLMDVIWPPEFAAAGWAAPLDAYFPPEEREKFLDGAILANTYEGHVYGVPLYVASGVLYYRADLLDRAGFQPPRTWPEMVSQARAIMSQEAESGREIDGFSGQFKQYEGLVCDMMEYILSNGGHVLDPETGQSVLHEAAAVEAVRFVQREIIGHVAPRGVLTYQEPESLALFAQGRAVFHRNWPYAWEWVNNPERSKISGKVGITNLPHFPGGESRPVLGGWQVGVSAYSAHPEAAWTFAEFLTSEKVQKLLARGAGFAPTRKVLYEDREVLEKNPQFGPMEGVFLSAYPRPRTPLYPALSNVLQRYFSVAISDPETDVAAEAKATSQELNKLLSLAR